MANTPKIKIYESANGKLATINGKSYTLLRMYEESRLDGIFFLVVAGRVPLRADDLGDYWRVFRSGDVYLAMSARPFSYHLIQGEGTPTDTPKWPGLRTYADYYAFVGPTEQAVHTLIELTLERYQSKVSFEEALDHAIQVPDECGGPPAYLLDADTLVFG